MKNTLLILLNLIFVFNIYADNVIDYSGGFVALVPNGYYDQDGWALGTQYDGAHQNSHIWSSATNYVAIGGAGYLELGNNNSNDVTTVYLGNNITNPNNDYFRPIIETLTSFTGDLYIKTRDNVRLQTDHHNGVVIHAQNARNIFINGGTYDSTRRALNKGQYAANLTSVDNIIIDNATFLGPDVYHSWIVAPGGNGLEIISCPQVVLNNVICSGGNSRSITSFSGNGTINLNGGDGLILTSPGGQVTINGGEFSGGQAGDFSYDNNSNTNNYQVSTNNGYSVRITCADLLVSSNPVFSGPMYLSAASFTISSNSNAQIEHLISNSQVVMNSYTKSKISHFSGEGTLIISDTGEQFNKYDYDADQDGLSDSFEINISNTDPNNSDSDGDGLTDEYEVNTYNTDPNNSDSDGDGLSDDYEIFDFNTDPNNSDSDGDGILDEEDVNISIENQFKFGSIRFNLPNDYNFIGLDSHDGLIDSIPTAVGTLYSAATGFPEVGVMPCNFHLRYDFENPSLFVSAYSNSINSGEFQLLDLDSINNYILEDAAINFWDGEANFLNNVTTNNLVIRDGIIIKNFSYSYGNETHYTGQYFVVLDNSSIHVFDSYYNNEYLNHPNLDPATVLTMSDRVYSLDPIPIYIGVTNSYNFKSMKTRTELLEEVSLLENLNTVLSNQLNSMITTNEALNMMRDLRVGSKTFSVDNGSARVRMYVDESGNLTDWTNTPHVLELDIPADTDTKFFRFRMD